MKIEELRIGQLVKKKGIDGVFRITMLDEDGFMRVVEVTDEYDKRVFFRDCSEFELVTGNAI